MHSVVNIQRRLREFLWKCIHNTFRAGDFWSHMDALKINGRCPVCNVTESQQHIALECYSPEQKIIWSLTRQLWSRKYSSWPTLNWGLILDCDLVRFKTANGVRPEKERLFAILVSVGWHCIWNLRVNRVITNPGATLTVANIHNHWLRPVNSALRRDCIPTDKVKFGPRALRKQIVLNTWSGLLG
jgi:ribonuclease HI